MSVLQATPASQTRQTRPLQTRRLWPLALGSALLITLLQPLGAYAQETQPITPTAQKTREYNLKGQWQCQQSRAIPGGGQLSVRFNTRYTEDHRYQTQGALVIRLPQQRLTYDISAQGRWTLQAHELQEDAQQHFEPSNPAARQLAQSGQFDPNREQASTSFNRYEVVRLDAETLVLRTPKPHSLIHCRRP